MFSTLVCGVLLATQCICFWMKQFFSSTSISFVISSSSFYLSVNMRELCMGVLMYSVELGWVVGGCRMLIVVGVCWFRLGNVMVSKDISTWKKGMCKTLTSK